MTFIITAGVSCKLTMYKEPRKHKNNLQCLDSYGKLNCLSTRRSELVLQLNEEVVVTAVVPFNVEVKHSLVVEAFTTGAHQRGQPEVVQQAVDYQPCHRYKVLVAGLTLLQKIHHFHGFVSDLLTSVEVLEPVSSNLTAVQTNQVQGT